jgi:hypothetical protein
MIIGVLVWFCAMSPAFAQHPVSDREILESVIYHFGQHFFTEDNEIEDRNPASDLSPDVIDNPGMAPMLALDSNVLDAISTTGSGYRPPDPD